MRAARPYRDHRLAVALAIVGVLAGLISGLGLFVGMI
jgi:5-enolpyruvylshikimate-3-phosphate synthase